MAIDLECNYYRYKDTNSFSNLVYDYIDGHQDLKPFYEFEASKDGIDQAIKERTNFLVNREKLVQVLQDQYKNLPKNALVENNIISFTKSTTFSICTAHQPNLLTGYLYFFYKILHAIKMTEDLNNQYPQHHFVPIYYMGSEDNDLDELGQFWYEGQKYKWDADGQSGAVGRMDTSSLQFFLTDLFQKFGPPSADCELLINTISQAYLNHKTIAEATFYLVHQLFGHLGLVIINPDSRLLKQEFVDVLKDELLNQTSYKISSEQTQKLVALYKAQAYPREINLFYLKDNLRERIEKSGERWIVLNTSISFNQDEILKELQEFPERFSPNVILRGLFQETILPNICFIGGGSELAYWMQLKPLFKYYNVFFPVLYLRQSVHILEETEMGLITQLGLGLADIFLSEVDLTKKWINHNNKYSFSLIVERKKLGDLFDSINQKARQTDKSLDKSVLSSKVKMEHQLKVIEQKIFRAQKRKEKVNVDRITRLKSKINPNGGLQERTQNFIPFYLSHSFSIFDFIKNKIKPFENHFIIIHPQKMKFNEKKGNPYF